MRIRHTLLALVTTACLVAIVSPAVALADPLLTNVYGLSFAGRTECIECHGANFDNTSHGNFAIPSAVPTAGAPGMWPAGRINVGETINAADIGFTLGAGTGLREYLKFTPGRLPVGNAPFAMLEGMEWIPTMPTTWEYGTAGIEEGDYKCSQCHQLGVVRSGVKPKSGHGAGAATATVDAWAWDQANDDPNAKATWVKGSSIQCESCHGTGVAADASSGGHWSAGVQIVGFGANLTGKAASKKILDSQVCGQCHGSYKPGSQIVGFTPDTTMTAFVTNYSFTDVPTEAMFMANPENYKFYPSGHNSGVIKSNGSAAGLKHSYYTEWQLSGHSVRSALTSSSPRATEYQKNRPVGANASRSILCNRCHTGEGYMKRKGATIMNDWVESTATAGQYGTECQVCHVAHKTTGGMEVRKPDAAGVGSNAGTTNSNKSLCEDCHNYQVEILGSPIALGASRVSHPQREVLAGRGMYDVPEATPFMPGAQCEECHMPATKSDLPGDAVSDERYGDQATKRYSHRMLIMQPGDAKRWGLDESGDSCSPCHSGESQDQLQANIDKWQSDTTSLLTEASAELAAAKGRSAAAGTDLDDRATTLVSFVRGDGSTGVHNPPYVKAGLEKAILFSKAVGATIVNVDASDPIGSGRVGFFGGKLLDGNGSPMMHQMVTIQKAPVGTSSWTTEGSIPTNETGHFAAQIAPSSSMQYRAVWTPRAGSTETISVVRTVAIRTTSTTTIRATSSSIRFGTNARVFGTVSPKATGQAVTIQRRLGTNGTWTNTSIATIGSTSAYGRTIYRLSRGTWYLRAVYTGTINVSGSTSAPVRVIVR